LGLTLILLSSSLLVLILMALILGSSLNALTTAASVWIMKSFDPSEWDERISWMMTTFQIGQVVGLVIISFLIDLTPQISFYVSIGFSSLSLLLVGRLIRVELNEHLHHLTISRRYLRCQIAQLPIPSTLPHFHLALFTWEQLAHIFRTRFGWLILGNVLQGVAAAFVFALFPLLYLNTFNVNPAVSSLVYGAATVITIIIFPVSGQVVERFGSVRVVQLALLIRCLCCLGLLVLALVDLPGRSLLAGLLFGIIVCAWPFIGIGFTLAIPEVATLEQGAAVGLFNASTAAANTIGAVVAGLAATATGYDSLPLFAFVVMAAAVGGLLRLPNRSGQ
jgi:MFS family permease